MIKAIFLSSCLFLFNFLFSQSKSKEDLLERSKKQKTTAWVLSATGLAAIITGVIVDSNVDDGVQSFTGGFIEVGGIICTLTSIPFFISSSKNKKRATTLTINNQKLLSPLNNSFTVKRHVSVSLNIPL